MSNIILQVIAIIKPSNGPEDVTSRQDETVEFKNFKNRRVKQAAQEIKYAPIESNTA